MRTFCDVFPHFTPSLSKVFSTTLEQAALAFKKRQYLDMRKNSAHIAAHATIARRKHHFVAHNIHNIFWNAAMFCKSPWLKIGFCIETKIRRFCEIFLFWIWLLNRVFYNRRWQSSQLRKHKWKSGNKIKNSWLIELHWNFKHDLISWRYLAPLK